MKIDSGKIIYGEVGRKKVGKNILEKIKMVEIKLILKKKFEMNKNKIVKKIQY